MSHLDRLSSLVSHFEIRAREPGPDERPNLIITGTSGALDDLWISFGSIHPPDGMGNWLAFTHLDFGGHANPILDALPDQIVISLGNSPELLAVASLISTEIATPRCGGQFALDRLCELLLVSVLRNQIEAQKSDTGVLSALADTNLSPVLVAIHDQPGKHWRLDDFVNLSGMSRSQFMDTFVRVIGKSPMAYLKHWRMTLARNALLNGERVKQTARRFGYGSGEAFTRAFNSTYGVSPAQLHLITRDIEPR